MENQKIGQPKNCETVLKIISKYKLYKKEMDYGEIEN